MIGRLSGTLLEKNPPQILLDVQGVAYEVDVPMSTFYNLPAIGAAVALYTHMVVREDAHLLFGFATENERRAFRQLNKVNGIGARTALSVLSGLSVAEEIVYPVLEDFQLDIVIWEGPAARSVKLDLPPFTLIGATTRAGMLTNPLRDRFGIVARLEFYTAAELTRIVTRSASLLEIPLDPAGSMEIARRSRGTPRIANRLLRRVRDYAEVKADGNGGASPKWRYD